MKFQPISEGMVENMGKYNRKSRVFTIPFTSKRICIVKHFFKSLRPVIMFEFLVIRLGRPGLHEP